MASERAGAPDDVAADLSRHRDAVANDAVALLAGLVRAASVNPPGNVRGPVAVAADWLRAHNLCHQIVSASETKPNIVASVEGGGGAGAHLILNAHLDTVPPGDEALWSVPPLDLTERDGRFYGLGTGNMKGAAAAMVHAYAWLAQHRERWAGRITLTLVADECSFGPDGAAYLLDTRPDLRGDAVLCGEGPGAMAPAPAEKGLLWARVRATGRGGQGMLTVRGGSATARLAHAIARLDALNDCHVTPPVSELHHADNREGMRPSVNVGRIEGGGFVSQAASEAAAEIDLRLPPGMTLADAHATLDEACAGEGLSWATIKGWEANWTDPDASIVRAVSEAARTVRGTVPAPVTRLPASDGARWRARGVPVVCYGPQPDLASGIDDHVDRADFLDCIAIYALAALQHQRAA